MPRQEGEAARREGREAEIPVPQPRRRDGRDQGLRDREAVQVQAVGVVAGIDRPDPLWIEGPQEDRGV